MIHRILKGLAPLAVLGMGALAGGCDGMNMRLGESDGVPLSELDTSGEPPNAVVLAGPDRVIIADGEQLAINVSGDPQAVDALRFTLENGALGIMRESDNWKDSGRATVRVTMPSLRALVIAGSGTIEAASLAGDAEITIGGSGNVRVASMDVQKLDLTLAGSGNLSAAGSAERLDLSIAGSGSAAMADLQVGNADISIAGSGDARFASDGNVEANILGSGNVTVYGRANCSVNAVGSGTLDCRPAQPGAQTRRDAAADTDETPPSAPASPPAPAAPPTPEAPDAPEA